jgi:hypothetical protein
MASPLSMTLSKAEQQLIEEVREKHERSYHICFVIEHLDGAWEVAVTAPFDDDDKERTARGVGETFDKAWGSMKLDRP